MTFFSSQLGSYVVQVLLHAFVAMFVVSGVVVVWPVNEPQARFRYHFLVLLLPVVMPAAFAVVAPERDSFYFRHDWALFDSQRWMVLAVGRHVSVGLVVFVLVTVGTTAFVVMQEIVPILRHRRRRQRRHEHLQQPSEREQREVGLQAVVDGYSRLLSIASPRLRIVPWRLPVSFTEGARESTVVLSRGLVNALTPAQLRATIAHELGHVVRNSNVVTLAMFLLRLFTFYSPVSLLVFRSLVQDEEQVCDDLAVQLTGGGEALRQALATVLAGYRQRQPARGRPLRQVQREGQQLLLEQRIARLPTGVPPAPIFNWGLFAITTAAIISLSFFIE